MIVYKYVSLNVAMQIINNNSIGFSCLEDLNDPFECTAFGFQDTEISASLATNTYKNNFSRKYALLSLTRQPLNALMWSHYGDSHQGVVIGFNLETAKLTCGDGFVIPAQFGEIVYTSSKPKSDISLPNEDELYQIGTDKMNFNSDIFNIMKRAFLYKSVEWSYEEEIRVIKNISSFPWGYHSKDNGVFIDNNQTWNKVYLDNLRRSIYCYNLPDNAISEIYLGVNVYKNISRSNTSLDLNPLENLKNLCMNKSIKIYRCESDVKSWDMKAVEI